MVVAERTKDFNNEKTLLFAHTVFCVYYMICRGKNKVFRLFELQVKFCIGDTICFCEVRTEF